MDAVLYEFGNFDLEGRKNYIFQFVKGRKLTDIYHSHDFYELILTTRGSGVQLINERKETNTENEIIILRPSDRHCFISQSEDIEIVSLSVKKEEFEKFANAYDPLLLKHINGDISPVRISSQPESVLSGYSIEAQIMTEYDCKLLLSFFLNAYISKSSFLKTETEMPPMLLSAIEEMKKTENLKRGIDAFKELSHYSQSHLSRLIKSFFLMSLKQYINELRLQSAYSSIVLTNTPIEEIAEDIGFSSFSHFNKIFKERFSVTPAALRKSNGVWTA